MRHHDPHEAGPKQCGGRTLRAEICTQTAPKRGSHSADTLYKKSSLRLPSKTGQRWKAEQKLNECQQKNLFPSRLICMKVFHNGKVEFF
jgi:hypothetical protein